MTTIVADARTRIMVSDSRWSDGAQAGAARKVYRIRGDLVGFAGGLGQLRELRAWFQGGRVGKPPAGDATALILRGGKIFHWSNTDGECEERSPYFAIGTGADAARGALMAGADAVTAVRVAKEIDPGTGGRIRIYKGKDA